MSLLKTFVLVVLIKSQLKRSFYVVKTVERFGVSTAKLIIFSEMEFSVFE